MKKKKNSLTSVVVILIVLIIGLAGFIAYDKVFYSKYTLNVLKSDISYCDSNKYNTCSDVIYKIKTNVQDAKLYNATLNFALYNDNGLKIYNNKTKEIIKLNLETNYETYKLHISEDENKIIGIICYSYLYNNENNEPRSAYYSLALNKFIYENKYVELFVYSDDFISASDGVYPSYNHLLYTSHEEELISGNNLSLKETNNSYYIVDSTLYTYHNIYTKDKKIIASNIDYKNLMFKDDNLYIINDNKIQKYDVNGNLVETISKYLKPLGFIKENGDYIVYINNNILEIENINTKEIIKIADWNNKYELTNYSVYLKDDNKICIALNEKGKELVGIEYYYSINTKEITSKKIDRGFTYQSWD